VVDQYAFSCALECCGYSACPTPRFPQIYGAMMAQRHCCLLRRSTFRPQAKPSEDSTIYESAELKAGSLDWAANDFAASRMILLARLWAITSRQPLRLQATPDWGTACTRHVVSAFLTYASIPRDYFDPMTMVSSARLTY
jgi:hypothetical protein